MSSVKLEKIQGARDLPHGRRPGLYTPVAGATGMGLVGIPAFWRPVGTGSDVAPGTEFKDKVKKNLLFG
jgi:hypothetical protein